MRRKVVVDVFEGEENHVARFIKPMSRALKLAQRELQAGFSVNIIEENSLQWGEELDFDRRVVH